MAKYTNSKDGVERLTVNIPLRFSKQDLEDMKPLAKADGYTSVLKWVRAHAPLAWGYWVDEREIAGDGEED